MPLMLTKKLSVFDTLPSEGVVKVEINVDASGKPDALARQDGAHRAVDTSDSYKLKDNFYFYDTLPRRESKA